MRITFIQDMHLCDECYKLETENNWEAIVNIRQKVLVITSSARRWITSAPCCGWSSILSTPVVMPTASASRYLQSLSFTSRQSFLSLHNTQIVSGGLDFYFAKRGEAQQFVDYIRSVVICTCENSPDFMQGENEQEAEVPGPEE